MNEFETALYARLTGAAALTALLATPTSVFNLIAPRDAALDYVIFGLNAGGPVTRSPRRAESLLYLAKGVSLRGLKRAGEIDAAIDAALHNAPLTVVGWANYWLMRESRVRFDEALPDGRVAWHSGGLYRARLGA